MATSMKRSVLGQGSDFLDEDTPMCEPCSVAGDYVPAHRFCSDCQEHLCQKCSKYHVSQKLMRDHILLTLEDIKKAPSKARTDKCSYKCNDHKDKTVEYYCEDHSCLGCSACITIKHKQCSEPVYIPTVAADIINQADFKKFDTNLKSLETACKAGLDDVEKLLKQVEVDESQIKTTFNDFRKRLNNALDQFESEVTTKAKEIKQEETRKLKSLSKELENSLSNIGTLTKKADALLKSGHRCDLFVMVKQDEGQLVRLSGEIDAITRDKSSKRFSFQPNSDLLKPGVLGSLDCRTVNVSSGRNIPAIVAPIRQAGQTKPADTRSTTTSRKTAPVKTEPTRRGRSSPAAPATRSQGIDWGAMAAHIKVGDRVRRGRDWGRADGRRTCIGFGGGDEDGGGLGTVVHGRGDGWCVRWDRGGEEGWYRMGGDYGDVYDLQIVEH